MFWCRRIALFVGLTWTLSIVAQEAQELPQGKSFIRPYVAFASAKKSQKKTQITVRAPSYVDEFRPTTYQVPVYTVQEQDGKKVVVTKLEKVEGVARRDVPGPLVTVTLTPVNVKAQSIDGTIIPPGKWADLLATEKPVLLNFQETFDPFHLLTCKPDTVVLTMGKTKIYPDVAFDPKNKNPIDIKGRGAFGFPQAKAKVLCDNDQLRFSVWTDNNLLYAQAVLWNASTIVQAAEKKVSDYGMLLLDLDKNGKITGELDRFYMANHHRRLSQAKFIDQVTTSMISEFTQGNGSVNFMVQEGTGKFTRIDSFAIPLLELKLNPGETIRLAYWGHASQLNPKEVNSISPKEKGLWNELPWGKFHLVKLEPNAPAVRMIQVPDGQ